MAEIDKVQVKMYVNLWSDLLSKLSGEGLSDLESAVKGERYRRQEIKQLEYPIGMKED